MVHPKETLEDEIHFSFYNRKTLIVFDDRGKLYEKAVI